jgi:hypothetical protein
MVSKPQSAPDVFEETARILFLTYGREAVEMAALRCAELKKAGDNAGLASGIRNIRPLAT